MQDTVGDQGLTFGSRLRQLREAAGLTQEELALRAGLSPRAISALERGGGNDPTRTLCARSRTRWSSPKKYAPPSWHPCRGARCRRSRHTGTTPEVNLPVPPTPLLGREREREEIRTILREVRLLTLTGLGGVGKGAPCPRAARDAAEDFPDGVEFVALASLTAPVLVIPTVARCVGLRKPEAGARMRCCALTCGRSGCSWFSTTWSI